MLACVLAIWNAKSKLEIEVFQQSISEIMALYHPKIVDCLVTYSEFNTEIEREEMYTDQ